MRHVASVAGRDLRGLFLSPVAYGLLALFSVLCGLFFILNLAWFNDLVLRLQPTTTRPPRACWMGALKWITSASPSSERVGSSAAGKSLRFSRASAANGPPDASGLPPASSTSA